MKKENRGFSYTRKWHGLCRSLLLMNVLVTGILGTLPVPRAVAELNQDIDLVSESGLRNVTQRAALWQNLEIGPNQDIQDVAVRMLARSFVNRLHV